MKSESAITTRRIPSGVSDPSADAVESSAPTAQGPFRSVATSNAGAAPDGVQVLHGEAADDKPTQELRQPFAPLAVHGRALPLGLEEEGQLVALPLPFQSGADGEMPGPVPDQVPVVGEAEAPRRAQIINGLQEARLSAGVGSDQGQLAGLGPKAETLVEAEVVQFQADEAHARSIAHRPVETRPRSTL